MASRSKSIRLPPEVNRILYVRNLSFKVTAEEMYEIFGKFGSIRQIRVGNTNETKGTAFVVYEDIYAAKSAQESLNGFNVGNRYLVVLYYQVSKANLALGLDADISRIRARVSNDESE
jgi:pre-mRNA branch site protein p14